jgi:hypothetical protein
MKTKSVVQPTPMTLAGYTFGAAYKPLADLAEHVGPGSPAWHDYMLPVLAHVAALEQRVEGLDAAKRDLTEVLTDMKAALKQAEEDLAAVSA